MRVGIESRPWAEGKATVFDDSFEHEVWHRGAGPRVVLIVDVWHPQLSEDGRQRVRDDFRRGLLDR